MFYTVLEVRVKTSPTIMSMCRIWRREGRVQVRDWREGRVLVRGWREGRVQVRGWREGQVQVTGWFNVERGNLMVAWVAQLSRVWADPGRPPITPGPNVGSASRSGSARPHTHTHRFRVELTERLKACEMKQCHYLPKVCFLKF